MTIKKVALVLAGRTKESTSSVDLYNLLDIFMNNFGVEKINSFEPLIHIESLGSQKYVSPKFTKNDKQLFLSREDGFIDVIELNEKRELIKQKQFHEKIIMDFDLCSNEDFLLTASIDGTSKIIDMKSFEVIKSFHPLNPTRNINACKFSPLMEGTNFNDFLDCSKNRFNAVIAGGQDSRNVTTTNAKEGGFDLEFINFLTGQEVGSLKGHFGPVNALAFSPNGKILASGAEDATVRIHKIDSDYFETVSQETKLNKSP